MTKPLFELLADEGYGDLVDVPPINGDGYWLRLAEGDLVCTHGLNIDGYEICLYAGDDYEMTQMPLTRLDVADDVVAALTATMFLVVDGANVNTVAKRMSLLEALQREVAR